MANFTKARTIKEAWRACDLVPLTGEKLQWWVDLSKARGASPKTRLESYFDLRPADQCLHVAFTGHRGCGK